MNGLLFGIGQVCFPRRWYLRIPGRKFLPAIANRVVRLLEMGHCYLYRQGPVPALHGVDDRLMRRHDEVAEVFVGDVAVEEEDVDLGSQGSPCVVQAAVPAGSVHDVVELQIELSRLLLRDAALHQLGDPVDDALQLGDILVGRMLDAALDRQALDRNSKRVDLVEVLTAELGDERAAIPADHDQPFALELGQRFTDWAAAYAHGAGELLFGQALAGTEIAVEDGAAQALGDVDAQAAIGGQGEHIVQVEGVGHGPSPRPRGVTYVHVGCRLSTISQIRPGLSRPGFSIDRIPGTEAEGWSGGRAYARVDRLTRAWVPYCFVCARSAWSRWQRRRAIASSSNSRAPRANTSITPRRISATIPSGSS